MPSLSLPKLARPSFNVSLGRRSGANVVGLDIQPGHITAVQAHVNGAVVAERAAAMELPADIVREGEVLDAQALGEALRELFAGSGLNRRVRVGVANQRTVLRTLDLPPITDRKELDAAVRFEAQEQVPMPLANASLDFHALGVHDTPAGPRQRIVLVAAQRDMIGQLLAAVRNAGLRPEGVDLSAFALIRSLYRQDPEHDGRVLYLNVDGLTNMAIAEGPVCRFTRVVGGGLEAMASELAERRGAPVSDARAAIAFADLTAPAPAAVEPRATEFQDSEDAATAPASPADPQAAEPVETGGSPEPRAVEPGGMTMASSEQLTAEVAEAPVLSEPGPAEDGPAEDVRIVLDNGIREIAGEVRNSLDFHRSQEGGGEVELVVLSGAALDIPGFADALQTELGVPLTRETVAVANGAFAGAGADISPQRLTIAAGLSIEEAHTR